MTAYSNWGKTPGGFGNRPYRSAVEGPKMAEFRVLRSNFERMLHLRARTFAPLTRTARNPLEDKEKDFGQTLTLLCHFVPSTLK